MKQIALVIFSIFVTVVLVTVFFTVDQVNQEKARFQTQVEDKSGLLLSSLKTPAATSIDSSSSQLSLLFSGLDEKKNGDIEVLLYDKHSVLLASSSAPLVDGARFSSIADQVIDNKITLRKNQQIGNKDYYYIFTPLESNHELVGALGVVIDMSAAARRIGQIWSNAIFSVGIWFVVLTVLIFGVERLVALGVVDTLRRVRSGKFDPEANQGMLKFLFPWLVNEVSQVNKSLSDAKKSASEEARLRLEKLETPWTSQRLSEFVKLILKGRGIYVVSNREPYIHIKKGNSISYYEPASGMVTAIEPMMSACGGVWIATGSGNADRLVVDHEDKLRVPPEEPTYTLKRMWLTPEEERGFYLGFSNEGLWPLCHIAHTRPTFRKEDWEEYKKVNGKFAAAVLAEVKNVHRPIIFVQDYLFALVPRIIKKSRPDALIGVFWHIPWPNSEAFRICPWRKELLRGLLGADLLGFHTQLHCNNFIDTVGRELEALINRDRFVVTHENHESHIRSFPISIPFVNGDYNEHEKSPPPKSVDIKKQLGIISPLVGVGVDRLDYTKGIVERLRAVETFIEKNPAFKERFTFIQLGEPSRSQIPEYRDFEKKVESEAARINEKLKAHRWKPIIFVKRHHSHAEIYQYFRIANVCLVTSLHDGMNLVAKEYISARGDEQGVLILSQFTGASHDLREALIVNPYDIAEVAEAIRLALQMLPSEQKKRMTRMRSVVRSYNIYRWSAEYLKALVEIE